MPNGLGYGRRRTPAALHDNDNIFVHIMPPDKIIYCIHIDAPYPVRQADHLIGRIDAKSRAPKLPPIPDRRRKLTINPLIEDCLALPRDFLDTHHGLA